MSLLTFWLQGDGVIQHGFDTPVAVKLRHFLQGVFELSRLPKCRDALWHIVLHAMQHGPLPNNDDPGADRQRQQRHSHETDDKVALQPKGKQAHGQT